MLEPVRCPFCNSAVPVALAPRASCPRCGESFPVRGAIDPGTSSSPVPIPSPGSSSPSPEDNRIGPYLLVGLGLAAAILIGGWFLVLRPDTSTEPTDPTTPRAAITAPPNAVLGLGYLPADTNVLFVAQPGPLLVHAERTGSDPKQTLTLAGWPERLTTLLNRLGVPLEQIDHLALGLTITREDVVPRITLALMRTGPHPDRSVFLKQLKAMPLATASNRWKVDLGIPLPFEMSQPDPKVDLFATTSTDLDIVPRGRGAMAFPQGLRDAMARLSPASCVWIATDSQPWGERPAIKALAAVLQQPDFVERLAGVRSLAVGSTLEPGLKWTAAVQSASVEAAQRLQDQLANRLADKPVQIGGEGAWVTLDIPPEADIWTSLVKQLPVPKK